MLFKMKEKLYIGTTSIFVFISPITPLMFTIGGLIIADTITGIWKSIKKDGWISITSNKLSTTLTKIILYNLGVITGYCVESFMVPEVPMTRVAAGFIGMIEMKSLWENIGEITGIDVWNKLKLLFNKNT